MERLQHYDVKIFHKGSKDPILGSFIAADGRRFSYTARTKRAAWRAFMEHERKSGVPIGPLYNGYVAGGAL